MTSSSRAEGFGEEVQRRILIGTYALSAGYVDAYYKKGPAGAHLDPPRF
jgi:aspartyl-tRNA(Asn)/glutamyl-tRNA(Gln) amidotransferase subunit A